MATFADFYNQYVGQQPNYQVAVPPQPSPPQRGGGGGQSPLMQAFSFGDPGFGALFGGREKPKQPATGAREFYKGRALLNAYNWLLPYTAETVSRGAEAFGDIYRREAAKSKAYELAQFSEFAPRYAQAILSADPRQADLLELFNRTYVPQAQAYADRLRGQLDQPMSSAAARDITQASLGTSALKGFGTGARDAALAYVQTGLVGEQLQRQREADYLAALQGFGGAAQTGVGLNKAVLGDPFMAFAGRPGQPQGANIQSPNYGGFNEDLFSYGVNAEMLRKQMAAANSAGNKQLIGQIVGGLLGVAGGALGGA